MQFLRWRHGSGRSAAGRLKHFKSGRNRQIRSRFFTVSDKIFTPTGLSPGQSPIISVINRVIHIVHRDFRPQGKKPKQVFDKSAGSGKFLSGRPISNEVCIKMEPVRNRRATAESRKARLPEKDKSGSFIFVRDGRRVGAGAVSALVAPAAVG